MNCCLTALKTPKKSIKHHSSSPFPHKHPIKAVICLNFSLDPSSIQAREGMERVEKHNEMGLEGSYDVEVEDVPGSDNEV